MSLRSLHIGCGGEIDLDYSVAPYHYTDDDGNVSEVPVYRCTKCGNEIGGDAEIEFDPPLDVPPDPTIPGSGTTERVTFRLLVTPCCSTMLCWVNPRFPNYCPECGKFIFPEIKGCVLVSDDNAFLRRSTQ